MLSSLAQADLTQEAGERVGVTGLAELTRNHAFDDVRDIVRDARDRLIVLDGGANELVIFSAHGEYLQRLSGYRSDEGAFAAANALAVSTDGALYLFDMFGRVVTFDMSGDSIVVASAFETGLSIYDGCAIGEWLYVHAVDRRDARVVRTYSRSGNLRAAFGKVYDSDNRVIQRQLSRGNLACVDATGLLLLAPSALPEVIAFDTTGTVLWYLEIDDFQSINLFETRQGGSRMEAPPSGYHVSMSLVPHDSQAAALLQIAHWTPLGVKNTGAVTTLHTLIVSGRGPAATYLGTEYPRVFLWSGPRIISVVADADRP